MKSLFEALGFVFTALVTGVLAFMYIGHTKNTKTEKTEIKSYASVGSTTGIEYDDSELTAPRQVSRTPQKRVETETELPEPVRISKPATAEKRKATAVEEKPVSTKKTSADKIKELYEDENYVETSIEKWKKKVADVSKENDIHPQFLLANCIIKSYLGKYDVKDFSHDVAQHIADRDETASEAVKFYDNAPSITRLVKLYELETLFPKTAKPMVVSKPTKKEKTKEKEREKSRKIAEKPTKRASIEAIEPAPVTRSASPSSSSEKSFREMVARQEGFETWEGLQFLADPETKKNAEKRVKLLANAARVK